ncbi:MAG: hypothetical protein HZA49_07250 [Planctomycetes bacterium]|nr:hypothetical protein [Planctomycetota bacterium]
MSKATSAKTRPVSNLYRFIRLMMGDSVTDTVIARKWNMDIKNFSDFKFGKNPVPRVERLVTLAKILGIDDHLVYEVAKGKPAEYIHRLIASPAGRKKLAKTITIRYTVAKLAEAVR